MSNKFSIITVTLNNLESLKKTHQSLIEQRCQDLEWIVIDGNSTDGTTDYLESTKANWLSESDRGIYDAMNKGIERATGQYLWFLNAGDTLSNNETLQIILNALHNDEPGGSKETPALVYGSSYENERANHYLKPARSHNSLQWGLFTHHQSMIYRRDAIGDLRYDKGYKIAGDYDFTARFLRQNNNDALFIDKPLCVYKSGGLSQMQAALGRFEQFQIRENLKIVGPLKNRIILLAQALAWNFRAKAPAAYWVLKGKSSY